MWDQPDHIQRMCLPDVDPAVRPLLLDRALLLEKAAAWGVPVPEGVPLGSRADCDAAIAGGLPLMVKSGRSMGALFVALCRTPEEVIDGVWAVHAAGRVGDGAALLHGSDLHGRRLVRARRGGASLCPAKRRSCGPKLTGYAFEMRSSSEPYLSQLQKYAESVCKQLGWTGMAGFDFVLGEDGEFRFVDFNPRLWGCADATLSAGVELYDGLARWIRDGDRRSPDQAAPGNRAPGVPEVRFRAVRD